MNILLKFLSLAFLAVLLAGTPRLAPAIGGGVEDGVGHPNVGLIGFDLDGPGGSLPPFALCTAFVASDSVVVTAAHCIEVAPGAAWAITLQPGSPASPVNMPGIYPNDFPFPFLVPPMYATEVIVHPRYGEGEAQANDVAVLRFPEGTFAGVRPVQLPGKRELDVLAAGGGLRGQSFTLVGYGTVPIDRTTERKEVLGYRQVASAPFQGLTTESLVLQMTPEATNGGSVCAGDSGGPQFLGTTNLVVSLLGGVMRGDSPCGTGARFLQRLDTPVIRDFLGEHVVLP